MVNHCRPPSTAPRFHHQWLPDEVAVQNPTRSARNPGPSWSAGAYGVVEKDQAAKGMLFAAGPTAVNRRRPTPAGPAPPGVARGPAPGELALVAHP